jgi:hypothetical protein
VTGWLEPLYKRLCLLTLTAYVLGVDDTGLKVIDHKHPKHIKRDISGPMSGMWRVDRFGWPSTTPPPGKGNIRGPS